MHPLIGAMEPSKAPPVIKVSSGNHSPELQQDPPPSIKRSPAMPTAVTATSPARKSPSVNTAVITPPKASAAASASGDNAAALGASQQTNISARSCEGGASYAPNFVPPDAVDSPAASKAKRAAAPGVNPAASSGGSQRPQSKRSKSASSRRSPIDTLDLSSPIRVRDIFIELKGADECIPGDLLSALKAILMVYTVPELSEFSVEKTRVEWPKGAKTIGVHKLAEFFLHELNCLHEAGGNSLPIEWPPGNNTPNSKSDTVNEDSTKCNSRGSDKTEGITLS